jgi:F-box/leucine-rich repeat protein 2/20
MDLEDCILITDTAIINLSAGCPNLTSLTLSHCENLTDNAIAVIAASHKNRLRILELDNCPGISDAVFDSMRPVANLERLDLFDCELINRKTIESFRVRLSLADI